MLVIKRFLPALALGLLASGSAFAANPDFSTLTTAVDFSTVVTAIMGIGAALMMVFISVAGVKMILGMVKSGAR